MPKVPYPFQEEAISLGLRKNALVADRCGLGKTITALEIARRLGPTGLPYLVICNKTAIPQWVDAIRDQVGAEAEVLRTSLADRPAGERWYVSNWGAFLRNSEYLAPVLWKCIIADEAHKISHREAATSKKLKKLTAMRKIALTGTPIERNVADIWSIAQWLYPEIFTSYWNFFESFVPVEIEWYGRDSYQKVLPGLKEGSEERFGRVIGSFSISRTKKDVGFELPPLTATGVEVPLDPKQRKAYALVDKADDILVEELDLIIKNELTRILRLQQISTDPLLVGQDLPSAKYEWLDDYIKQNPDEQMVIFNCFQQVAHTLAKRYNAAVISGKGSDKLMEFMRGEQRLLFATIGAAGESLNLGMADTAIFLNEHWSARKMEQAVERIHRLDIVSPKQAIFVRGQDTVDTLIAEGVAEKWAESRLALEYVNRKRRPKEVLDRL